NRTEIKNGSILCLSTAPDLEAEWLLRGLQSESCEGRREALRHLVLLAPDMTFTREVISRDGLQRLGSIIEDGDDLGEVLALALRAFLELMEHGVVSWETLSIPFGLAFHGAEVVTTPAPLKVVCYVNMNLMDASVQPLALGLLESVTLSSPALGQLVKSEQLQTKAMALLTALLQGASAAERKHMLDYLWQRNLRQFIYKNIIHSAAPLGDEMAHHLYVLQALTLGLLEPRMRTPLDPYSQEQREQLQALRQAAFEPEGESLGTGLSADRRRSLCAREFRKLGFSVSDPYPAPCPCLNPGLLLFQRAGPFLSCLSPFPQNSNPAQDLERAPKLPRTFRPYKLWFCCLSPNHKVLQYGDVEEGVGPPVPESLPEQRKEGRDVCELAFSVSYDHGEEEAYLNFIAPSKREFHLWTDGLSALLGSPMG
ncbi:hypothetical protein E2I00_011733, partial [Balaenoptera physalus]